MNRGVCLLLFFLVCGALDIRAQFDQVWIFGRNGGVDFNYDPPRSMRSSISVTEGGAMICDTSGALLFYTDGTHLWDRDHTIMPNGFPLSGEQPASYIYGFSKTSSSSQSALIVPLPGYPYLYYVFSMSSIEHGSCTLYYSLVDMRLNNGRGDVVDSVKGIVMGTGFTEQLTSVMGDNCNVWMLTAKGDMDSLRAYRIDYRGIDTQYVSSYMPKGVGEYGGKIGWLASSADRRRIAVARGNLAIADFDPATGVATNARILDAGGLKPTYYGVAFSPSDSILYASWAHLSTTFQFDLRSGDIGQMRASRLELGSGGSPIRKAPNGKIYVGGSRVIQYPDRPGLVCKYEYDNSAFLKDVIFSMPNNIVFVQQRHEHTRQADSFCQGQGLQLRPLVADGMNYLWNDSIPASSLWIKTPGIYWVSYLLSAPGKCVYKVDTFHVNEIPFSTQLAFAAACQGAANGYARHVKPTPDGTVYRYQWRSVADSTILSENDSLMDIPPGDYLLQLSGSHGCDTTLYFSIGALDAELAFTVDSLVCAGDSVRLINESDAYFSHWLWSFGDGHFATERSPVYVFSNAGPYTIQLQGRGSRCIDTFLQTIWVDAPAEDLYFTVDRSEICVGETVRFQPGISDTPLHMLWDLGDDVRFSHSGALQHAYDVPGEKRVLLKASFRACPDMLFSDTLKVHALPLVDLGADTALCVGQVPLVLTNHVLPNEPVYYRWSTGDTTASIEATAPGTYSLTLFTVGGHCMSTEDITLWKKCFVDLPNTFTPNGDGHNDYFFPVPVLTSNIQQFKMEVFNRWGQMMFSTDAVAGRGWDGTFKGKPQPLGSYVYEIEGRSGCGSPFYKSGNVTLLR